MDRMKPIKLVKISVVKDADGNNVEAGVANWSTFAKVTRVGGDAVDSNGALKLNTTYNFKVRINYNFNPSGNWRVVYDGRNFDVSSIEKENENKFFWIITGHAKNIR